MQQHMLHTHTYANMHTDTIQTDWHANLRISYHFILMESIPAATHALPIPLTKQGSLSAADNIDSKGM